MRETHCFQIIDTPVGNLTIEASDTHILQVTYGKNTNKTNPNHLTKECARQLQEYFAGDRIDFDLPIKLHGTDFQKSVWQALTTIPYGQTISYAEQAKRINNPKAVRAVGTTNGKNPISIIIPCHRVIGTNGKLTGYGGGIDNKQWLLDHEKRSFTT